MSFNFHAIAAGLFVGAVGFVLFSFGMKAKRIPHAPVGFAMLVYPNFFDRALVILLIAPALLVLLFWMIRRGI